MSPADLAPALEALSRVLPPGTEISIRYVVPSPPAPKSSVTEGGVVRVPAPGTSPSSQATEAVGPMKLKEAAARYGVSKRSLDRAARAAELRCAVKTTGRDNGALLMDRPPRGSRSDPHPPVALRHVFVPPVLCGYLIQAVTHAGWLTALVWVHLVTGGPYLLGVVLHLPFFQSIRVQGKARAPKSVPRRSGTDHQGPHDSARA